MTAKLRASGSTRMRRSLWSAIGLIALISLVAAVAYSWGRSSSSQPGGNPPSAGGSGGANEQLTIWLTGYSWQDNTPPGSSVVGEPVLHKDAGGTGTYADPITVAVPGHQGKMDWQPGTRFYLPSVQRYVMVEDSGAAKPPSGDDTHLDMWIGGQDGTKKSTDQCEVKLTGNVPAQVNPPDNLPVMAGPIFSGGKCNIPPQTHTEGTYKGGNSDDSGDSSGDSSDSGDSGDSGSHHSHHSHHNDDSDEN